MNYSDVTRLEVIDEIGRAYVRYGVSVELHLQDEGRTLKVFVNKDSKLEPLGSDFEKVWDDNLKTLYE